jgi:hypothetical protein
METRTRNDDGRRAADRALARIARNQHGLFTTAQAVEVGLNSGVLSRRLAAARYERRWPGVYAVAGSPDRREARFLAALLLLGGDAALSHATAASVHGLEHRLAEDAIHLTVRQRTFTPRLRVAGAPLGRVHGRRRGAWTASGSRRSPGPSRTWSATSTRSGCGGWSALGCARADGRRAAAGAARAPTAAARDERACSASSRSCPPSNRHPRRARVAVPAHHHPAGIPPERDEPPHP